jgi:3-isopropylmalate/(R)-2-methylmalate dehydratase large subunit
MGMTAVEKILAKACGVDRVAPGDIVHPRPDWMFVHDNHLMATHEELEAAGIHALHDPDRVILTTDHDVIYVNERAIERGAYNRKAAAAWGVKRFYDVGRGGHGHIFPIEQGLVVPGTFYLDDDRHCTNAGGVGAIALRVGEEISTALATGTVWISVPPSVKLTLRGRLRPGVHARDLGFRIAQGLVPGGFFGIDADYRIIEMAGDLDAFDLASRVALCNSPTEVGAVGVFFPPSAAIIEQSSRLAAAHGIAVAPVFPDADAAYDAQIEIDLDGLEPQVALPGGVHRAANLSDVAGTPVQHAFIGSCGSGMWEDLEAAARVLAGRRIAPGVRLFVTPGTEASTRRLHREGLLDIFQEAGAVVMPAGCGVCAGGRTGPVTAGETSISTAANNGAGRFGAKDARLFLGSPATVAASAVAGCITDPRTFA